MGLVNSIHDIYVINTVRGYFSLIPVHAWFVHPNLYIGCLPCSACITHANRWTNLCRYIWSHFLWRIFPTILLLCYWLHNLIWKSFTSY